MRGLTEQAGAKGSDTNAVNIYLLREKYGTEIAFCGFMLMRRYHSGYRAGTYGYPLGEGDLHTAIRLLHTDAAEQNLPLRLSMLTKQQCQILAEAYPDCFTFSSSATFDTA